MGAMQGNKAETNTVKRAAISGVFFKLMERVGVNAIGLVVSVILARLLEPEILGIVVLAESVILLFSVIATYGFGNSLIQNKHANEVDISTAFFSSLMMAALLYIFVFIMAPFIEDYFGYKDYEFASVIKVLGLSLFPTSIKSIQQAIVAKRMKFEYFFYTSLITLLLSGIIGISMAWSGFGVWAVVAQFISSETTNMLILALLLRWTPEWSFSQRSLQWIWAYGWKLILVGVINVLYSQIRSFVIAKRYSSMDLAFYSKGLKFAQIVPENLSEALMAVLFPAFSNYAVDQDLLGSMRKSIRTSVFIVFPLILGLFSIADNLIVIILTPKWADSIPYLRIFCVSYIFYTIEQIIDQSIKAMGRSGTFLFINLIKRGIGIICLLITFNKGVFAIAVGFMASMIINYVINMYVSNRVLSYKFMDQFKDIYKELLISLLMVAACFSVNCFNIPIFMRMIWQIVMGAIVYIGVSVILKSESLEYIQATIKEYRM